MKNLRVNSKTKINEFKRKHNWLVESSAIQLNVSDIKNLSNDDIENLKCGDIVNKVDSSGKHSYIVSFKNETGICLTYADASVIETQSYDKIDGVWTYNSEDKTIIAEPSFENIVDKDGHKRFIENDGNVVSITGYEVSYCKWSLSGTHLALVLAGSFEDELVLTNGTTIATYDLPQWILDKIYPVWGGNLEVKNVTAYAGNWSNQICGLGFAIDTINNKLIIFKAGDLTLTAKRYFRAQFDLLIDNE